MAEFVGAREDILRNSQWSVWSVTEGLHVIDQVNKKYFGAWVKDLRSGHAPNFG